jgi:hypothetical protein
MRRKAQQDRTAGGHTHCRNGMAGRPVQPHMRRNITNLSPRLLKARADAQAAVSLRTSGLSWAQIGQRLGVCRQTAYRHGRRELAALNQATREEAAHLRDIELRRLDELQAVHWPKALQGCVSATDRILAIMTRRAKLLGHDGSEKTVPAATPPPDTNAVIAKLVGALDL